MQVMLCLNLNQFYKIPKHKDLSIEYHSFGTHTATAMLNGISYVF